MASASMQPAAEEASAWSSTTSPFGIPLCPLKVVQQAPSKVALHVDAMLFDSSADLCQVLPVVRLAECVIQDICTGRCLSVVQSAVMDAVPVSCAVASQLCSCSSAVQLLVRSAAASWLPSCQTWSMVPDMSGFSVQHADTTSAMLTGGSCRPLLHAGMAECQKLA